LLSVENSPQPETSGTAFFTYGMTWGINEGLLPEQEYLPNVIRGWNALNSAVHPDGKLGWVQQIGDAPDNVSYDDSQIYAVGAYLLAGSELYDFQLAKEK
jgi:unsaturated rhamnogalacturonyl hydrolase